MAKKPVSERVVKELEESIKPKVYEAVEEGDFEKAASLNIALDAARERRPRPRTAYILFMAECIKQVAADKTLGGTQKRVKECALRWRNMTPEQKAKYKTLAELKNKELGVWFK